MKEEHKCLLSKILSDRLLDNWNKCDQFQIGSEKYEILTDECNRIHQFVREESIPIDANIEARF